MRARSISSPASRTNLRLALRGSGIESIRVSSPNRVAAPLIRMTATPEGGGPLDSAKIVSRSVTTLRRLRSSPTYMP
jgi:hypothetical protein